MKITKRHRASALVESQRHGIHAVLSKARNVLSDSLDAGELSAAGACKARTAVSVVRVSHLASFGLGGEPPGGEVQHVDGQSEGCPRLLSPADPDWQPVERA